MNKWIKVAILVLLLLMALVFIPFGGWLFSSVFNGATNDPELNLGLKVGDKFMLDQAVFVYSVSEPYSLEPQNEFLQFSLEQWANERTTIKDDKAKYVTGTLPKGTILVYEKAEKQNHWNGGMTVLFYGYTSENIEEKLLLNGVIKGIEGNSSNVYLHKI